MTRIYSAMIILLLVGCKPEPPIFSIKQDSIMNESGLWLATWVINEKKDTIYSHMLRQTGNQLLIETLNEHIIAEIAMHKLCQCDEYYLKGIHATFTEQ